MENVWMAVLGVVVLFVMLLFVVGWLVPLIWGIVRMRRKTGGLALTIVGAAWGTIAIVLVVVGVLSVLSMRDQLPGASKSEEFNAKTYKGSTGKVLLPCKGATTLEVKHIASGNAYSLTGNDGEIIAPAGVLVLKSFKVSAKDNKGAEWQLSHYFWNSPVKEIFAREGETVRCELGGPALTASVIASHDDANSASLQLLLSCPRGMTYDLSPGGGSDVGFVVLSKTGETLWQGNFEAG
jgi:hypothetical protein